MWRHPKKTVFCRLSLLGELFFQKREFATEYFVFRRPCRLLATFRPKKEQRLLLYDRTVAATFPLSTHTPRPPPNHIFGAKIWQLFLGKKKFSPNLELVSPFGDFSAEKKDWSGLTLHKRIH